MTEVAFFLLCYNLLISWAILFYDASFNFFSIVSHWVFSWAFRKFPFHRKRFFSWEVFLWCISNWGRVSQAISKVVSPLFSPIGLGGWALNIYFWGLFSLFLSCCWNEQFNKLLNAAGGNISFLLSFLVLQRWQWREQFLCFENFLWTWDALINNPEIINWHRESLSLEW